MGAEHARNLVDFLQRQQVEILAEPASPEAAVRSQRYDMVLRIPEKYAQQWRSGEPAEVEIIVDRSRREISSSYFRLQSMLNSYGQQTGALRLYLRGIDPSITRAVAVREIDLSTPSSRGALILGMLPFFVLMTVFIGGMYLAIDTTAGEKERQSLEPLLINPVPRWQIMSGKLASTFCFCVLTLVVALLAFAVATRLIPTEGLGVKLNLSPAMLIQSFILVLPVALVASALQTIIAAFSKGFREAQTYLSFLQLLPMVPSMWLMLSPVKEQFWMSWVPLLSQSALINKLAKDEAVEISWMAASLVGSTLLGLLLAVIAARLYNRPALVFRGS